MFRVHRIDDLIYSSPGGRALLADLYLPVNPPSPPATVLFLHAGGWIAGDRRRGPDLSRHFAERGLAMASIDYRLSREAIFPAALDDVVAAIGWLRKVSPEYGLDPEKIGLWGASAGGHLAALAALSVPETRVKAVVAVYPPVDFLRMGEKSESPKSYESRFLGAPVRTVPELVRQANPAAWVRPGAPPFLLVHGTEDTSVPAEQSEILCEALRADRNEVTLLLLPGLDHGFLDQPSQTPPDTFDEIERFFKRHLSEPHQ